MTPPIEPAMTRGPRRPLAVVSERAGEAYLWEIFEEALSVTLASPRARAGPDQEQRLRVVASALVELGAISPAYGSAVVEELLRAATARGTFPRVTSVGDISGVENVPRIPLVDVRTWIDAQIDGACFALRRVNEEHRRGQAEMQLARLWDMVSAARAAGAGDGGAGRVADFHATLTLAGLAEGDPSGSGTLDSGWHGYLTHVPQTESTPETEFEAVLHTPVEGTLPGRISAVRGKGAKTMIDFEREGRTQTTAIGVARAVTPSGSLHIGRFANTNVGRFVIEPAIPRSAGGADVTLFLGPFVSRVQLAW